MNEGKVVKQLDYGLLALLAIIAVMGLMALWSASHGAEGEVTGHAARQLKWLGVGVVAMILCLSVDYRYLQSNAWAIYIVLVLMLAAVLLIGSKSMGAQRWLAVGGYRVQPSEFMKIGIAIIIAHIYSNESWRVPYGLRQLIVPAIVTVIPAALIILQPDLGTAILVVGVAVAITAFQGVKRRVLAGIGLAIPILAPLFWFLLKPYQRGRIFTFLNPERDPNGAGYHIIQSKIAIGSGQLFGKGYMKGTQAHLKFLPERHTDFVFSVLAEEWGFLGSIAVIVVFALLIFWGLDIAAKARDSFGRLLALGLTSILFAHVFVNIGMVQGLLPVVGVPLPLFSYGGSSVLTTFLVVGLLLNIRMRRFSR